MPIVDPGIWARADAVESPFFATGDTQLISLIITPWPAAAVARSLGVPGGVAWVASADEGVQSSARRFPAIRLPLTSLIHQINRPGVCAAPRSFPCNHFGL